jgi:hypothetical protein
MKEIKAQPGFQENAVDCAADIAIIGGSAGCGKTFCLLFDPLAYVLDPTPGFNGIIFRRDSVQIKATGGLWDKARELYRQLPNGFRPATFGGSSHFKFVFPSGFDLQLAHLHDEDSIYSYQGTEIAYIAFDELTHFTEEQFFYMLSRNRSTSEVTPYVRASTNPQGEGWVKRLISFWIYPDDYEIELLRGAPIPERQGILLYMARVNEVLIMEETPEKVLEALDPEIAKDFPVKSIRSITFVAGKLFENEILMKLNPGYLGNLLGLSESERAQLLDGRWINLDTDLMRLYTNAAISDIFTNFVLDRKTRYLTADIALEGSDKFVIAIWEGWLIVEFRVFDTIMGDQVLHEIQKAAMDWQIPGRRIAFDAGGVGGILSGFLRTAYSFVANNKPIESEVKTAFHGKKNTEPPPQYANLRAQCFFHLRDKIENSTIGILGTKYQQTIEEELKAIRKMEEREGQKLRVIPKPQIKATIGRSPDFADVISMRSVFDLLPNTKPTKRRVSSF